MKVVANSFKSRLLQLINKKNIFFFGNNIIRLNGIKTFRNVFYTHNNYKLNFDR